MPRLTGFRLDLRNQCGGDERRRRRHLFHPDVELSFSSKGPFGTEETEGCSWKNLGISMYPCISSHRDKEKTTVDKASLYHGDDKNTGLGFRDWVSQFTVIVFIFLFIFLHLPQVLSGHVDSLPLNISSSNVCLCNTGD